MKDENGKAIFRNGIAIAAEISAVLTLILTWLMYRQAKNTSNTLTMVNTFLIISVLISVLSLSILLIITIYTIIKKIKKKSHTLDIKFESYIKSDPQYMRIKSTKEQNLLINKTRKAIKNLDESKAFEQDVYYMILYSLFWGAVDSINVVSILDDNEWVDTPEEDKFLRLNMAVIEKKVHLNRVFVVNKNEVKTKLNTKSIQSFIEADRTYIHLFVVFLDDLPRNIINDIGSGYIDFSKFAVACDVFSDNEIRGFLKTDTIEIDRYYKNFMRLSEYYYPINNTFIKEYLS